MIRDFLVFEIRKNLDLRKILITPKIFLKSRFHCTIFSTLSKTKILSPKWSTTPIMVGKHCWKPHCHNGVLDRLQSCIVGKSRWEEVQFLSLHRGDTKVGFTIFHPQKSWQKMLILESVQRPKLYLALNYQSEFQILNGLLTVTN